MATAPAGAGITGLWRQDGARSGFGGGRRAFAKALRRGYRAAMEYRPPATPAAVLHADAEILVVAKPAGLLSVPGKGAALADCLIERLRQGYPDVLLVHRLDRDTSGVMVFARTARAQRHLGLQFEKRQTAKSYVALVAGVPARRGGRIDLPIAVDWPNRPRQMICHATGRPAVTDWQVLGEPPPAGPTRVQLVPQTGRSHQLRLHMATLGHPILGDTLYSDDGPAHPRLMLHAARLGLRHPDGGRRMEFHAACPF
jgi:tRNA pseudouridine32 synthase/23S rRNA pseudouridine746 synthase